MYRTSSYKDVEVEVSTKGIGLINKMVSDLPENLSLPPSIAQHTGSTDVFLETEKYVNI